MKKLNISQIMSISMMLFAIFFGAGNMIFPPAMGQLAGDNYVKALAGFILTDVGIAILGIIAIALTGTTIDDLGRLVSKKFALFFSVSIYLLIGPLFALPRTATVSFEITFLPYLKSNEKIIGLLIFTFIFFELTYYLSRKVNKLVDIVGKILTPFLLISIISIFFMAIINTEGNGTLAFGKMMPPTGNYQNHPFFLGMMEGYNALDGPAGLAFAIIIINAIKDYGVSNKKSIVKYTIYCGLGSALFLSVVYFMLTYIGSITNEPFINGGAMLHAVTYYLFGDLGAIILGIAVLLACLATAIGLVSSFANYLTEITSQKWTYEKIVRYVCIFSFMIANIGLNQLIKISFPILNMIYPLTIVLIVLSIFKNKIKHRRMMYVLPMILTFIVSFINGMQTFGIHLGIVSKLVMLLPLNYLGFGWVSVAIVGVFIGYLPFWPLNKENIIKKN